MAEILVLGGGQVGTAVAEIFLELGSDVLVYSATMSELDTGVRRITRDYTDLEVVIVREQPRLCVHTTAIANVDICQEDQELARKVNIETGRSSVTEARKKGIKFIFIDTFFNTI